MAAFLIILNSLLHQGEGIVVRHYGKKYGSGGMFFNAIICLFAMIFFVVTDKNGLDFPPMIFLYGFISCLMFATGFYTMYLALQYGSFAATKLFSSFSGVFPIVYGIVFLKDPTSVWSYIGIVLTFLSLFIMNYRKPGSEEDKNFSLKWLISVIAIIVSNGMIAILQKMQQDYFNQAYDNEFMILSLGGASAALFIMGAILERNKFRQIVKSGTLYGALAGIFNGAANFVNLFIYMYIPISLMSPLKSGVGLIMTFLLSIFLYKETFTKQRIVSVITGCAAILMFNMEAILSLFIS